MKVFKVILMHEFNRYKNRTSTDGKGNILIRLYDPTIQKSITLNTKIRVSLSNWDKSQKRVIKYRYADRINKDLSEAIFKVEGFISDQQRKDFRTSLDAIKKFWINGLDTRFSVVDFCKLELEKSRHQKNYKGLKTFVNSLEVYAPNLYFDQVNYEWLSNFELHLKDQKLAVNTIWRRLTDFKRFLNVAYKQNVIKRNPFDSYKLKKVPSSTRIALTIPELKALQQLQLSNDKIHLTDSLQAFLLLCYTGMRVGDLLKINKGHVTQNEQGNYSLDIATNKTGKRIYLPLHSMFRPDGAQLSLPESIIHKWLNHPLRLASKQFDKAPLYGKTPQTFNRDLKQIAQLIDCRDIVKQHISTHYGRKTFVTNLYRINANPEVIRVLVGHTTTRQTAEYISHHFSDSTTILDSLDYGRIIN